MQSCRTGLESSEVVINGAYDDEFMVRTNTLSAEDAFTQIPDDERVGLLEPGIMGHGIEVYLPKAQFSGHLSQFTSVSLVAHNAGFGVIGHHEVNNVRAVFSDLFRIRTNLHIRRDRCDAGGHDPPRCDLFHEAYPTGASGFEVGMMAQGGNLETVLEGRIQDARASETSDVFSVNP